MKQSTIAKIALFVTAVLWGSTFTIGKLASEVFSTSFIIAFRFLIAGIILLIVAYPQRKQLDKKYWIDGWLKKKKQSVDFVTLTCYNPKQQDKKEVAEMMNNKFYFSYFYYFKKSCPLFVTTKV